MVESQRRLPKKTDTVLYKRVLIKLTKIGVTLSERLHLLLEVVNLTPATRVRTNVECHKFLHDVSYGV